MKYVGLLEIQKRYNLTGKNYVIGKIHNDKRGIFEDGVKIKTAPILEETDTFLITENLIGDIVSYLKVRI